MQYCILTHAMCENLSSMLGAQKVKHICIQIKMHASRFCLRFFRPCRWCRCVEIGCGSGYVICSVARLLKHLEASAHCIAVDINGSALECTAQTLQAHEVLCLDVKLIYTPIHGRSAIFSCDLRSWYRHQLALNSITMRLKKIQLVNESQHTCMLNCFCSALVLDHAIFWLCCSASFFCAGHFCGFTSLQSTWYSCAANCWQCRSLGNVQPQSSALFCLVYRIAT